ncbi:MAG: F0F1 ATP synthase subunit A [Rubrobacteraceae bacterium]
MTNTVANLVMLAQLSQKEVRKKILHTWEASHEWVIPIHIGPVDLSIDKTIWFLFMGTAITFFILFIGSRLLKDRPGAYQVIVEDTFNFGRNHIAGQQGEDGRKIYPYTLTLFVFILTLNLIGLVPNSYPVTSSISFTLTLALATLLITQYFAFRRNGVVGYYKSFAPPGIPKLMIPFIAGLELVQEYVTKPLTLGLRLYANMLAGHLLIFVFLSLILTFGIPVAAVSVPMAVLIYAFEIFVSIIQAYIFAILSQVYIEQAMFASEAH